MHDWFRRAKRKRRKRPQRERGKRLERTKDGAWPNCRSKGGGGKRKWVGSEKLLDREKIPGEREEETRADEKRKEGGIGLGHRHLVRGCGRIESRHRGIEPSIG